MPIVVGTTSVWPLDVVPGKLILSNPKLVRAAFVSGSQLELTGLEPGETSLKVIVDNHVHRTIEIPVFESAEAMQRAYRVVATDPNSQLEYVPNTRKEYPLGKLLEATRASGENAVQAAKNHILDQIRDLDVTAEIQGDSLIVHALPEQFEALDPLWKAWSEHGVPFLLHMGLQVLETDLETALALGAVRRSESTGKIQSHVFKVDTAKFQQRIQELKAEQEDSAVKTINHISSPRISSLPGAWATLEVGQELPVQKRFDGTAEKQIEFVRVGYKFELQAKPGPDPEQPWLIELRAEHQECVDPKSSAPTFSVRRVNTGHAVAAGEWLVVGFESADAESGRYIVLCVDCQSTSHVSGK